MFLRIRSGAMDKKYHIRKVLGSYDMFLLLIVAVLCAFGLIMIFSTSYYSADYYYSESARFHFRQLIILALGGPAMIVISFVDYHVYTKKFIFGRFNLIHLLYVVCIILLAVVKIIGESTNGSVRWIPIGPIKFQPSEVCKTCFILFSAYYTSKNWRMMNKARGFAMQLIIAPIMIVIAKEDLSTGFILGVLLMAIPILVSGVRKYHLVICGIAAVGLLGFLLFSDYRLERVLDWFNPEKMDTASQTVQGLYAIGSGDLFGKGLGEGLQKLGKIQEVHTDMIFTVVCEELGIIGAVVLICLFLALLWKIYSIALRARDTFGGLICAGVFIHIALQVMINLCVVTGLIPSTGIPLPFISYGGSSTVVLLGEIGMVLNVSKQIPREGEGDE
ncbi:MAG: putative lipid II flippase FtsW [Lachnospiraceae bacterium]|nr:putative lipid II flippase FtsW [Lachnospiraceae bacterium]